MTGKRKRLRDIVLFFNGHLLLVHRSLGRVFAFLGAILARAVTHESLLEPAGLRQSLDQPVLKGLVFLQRQRLESVAVPPVPNLSVRDGIDSVVPFPLEFNYDFLIVGEFSDRRFVDVHLASIISGKGAQITDGVIAIVESIVCVTDQGLLLVLLRGAVGAA